MWDYFCTFVADVLSFQPGLRVENTCSNCGKTELRINGLQGQYTQILMYSRPVFSSMAAVGGQVSLITLDPNLRPEYSHSATLSADWIRWK